MKLSYTVLSSLQKKYTRGDYSEIEKISGMPAQQIARAMRTGRMSNKTFLVLSDYFQGKQEKINLIYKGRGGIIIYSLSHPNYPFDIYIGQTQNLLQARLGTHLTNPSGQKIKEWIRELLKNGLIPNIEQIETCDMHQNLAIERFWIEQFRSWGFNMLNA